MEQQDDGVESQHMHAVDSFTPLDDDRRRSLSSTLIDWATGASNLFPLMSDIAIWPIAISMGAALKLVFDLTTAAEAIFITMVAAVLAQASLGFAVGLYRGRWRMSSFEEVAMLGSVWAGTSVMLVAGSFYARLLDSSNLPTSAVVTGCLAAGAGLTAERIVWRRFWQAHGRTAPARRKRTIVCGSSDEGEQLVRAMLADARCGYHPVALIDDDPSKVGLEVCGVQVRGTREQLADVVAATDAETLLVAVTSADAELISALNAQATVLGLELRVLPSSSELLGRPTLADVRPPTVDDLIGRDPVEIDLRSVTDYIRGRRVLVTGAGGSIGAELSKQIYRFGPSQLHLLDRDENALHRVQLQLEGRALFNTDMLLVADIRDRGRVFEIFERCRPEVVFHAAALKHLTLLESHPSEGVKTNALGTKNLLDAAMKVDVERFINVSTDKAADPTSVLGATELVAERLTSIASVETGRAYLSVRFGNVLRSSGSVVETFVAQLERGAPLMVTHPDVTRYFSAVSDAVQLSLQAGAIGQPGEVVVLDIGKPVRVADLAAQLIAMVRPGTPVEFTGLQPGEKLQEVLLGDGEIGARGQHPRIIHLAARPFDPCELLARVTEIGESDLRDMLAMGSHLRLVGAARSS